MSDFANPDVLPKREKAFVAVFDDLVEAITEMRTEWSQHSHERVRQKRSEYSRWIDDQLFKPLIETAIDCADLRIGTPAGRATINALQMNRPAIIAIRHELHLVGRFPPT